LERRSVKMDKFYYEDELINGYAMMAELNLQLAKETFQAEVEAEFMTYENLK
jgi:hypothetical protein